MAERKDPPCQGIVDLDRENLCVVDGVVFEKDSFQRYIREEHRPHPKLPETRIQDGAQDVETCAHPTSGISPAEVQPVSSAPAAVSSFTGSMPKFTSFSGFSSQPTSAVSAFLKGGYGLDLI